MSIVSKLFNKKKKQRPQDATATVTTTDPTTGESTEFVPPEKTFQEWFDSLSPEDKRRIEKRIERDRLRHGTAVVCVKCGHPGGKFNGKGYSLIKIERDKYMHDGACPG